MTHPAQSPSRQVLIKFALLLALLVAYFIYLWVRFDAATGAIAAALTWSFFVLCTPIADAGFLLDFPLRLLFGVRMVVSEVVVWALAGFINGAVLLLAPHYYQTTSLTRLFHEILLHPWPYWLIVLLSGAGTFLSVKFGDELMDVLHHRDRDFFHSHQFKHELIMVAFFAVIVFAYYRLITTLGLEAVL
ncbi:hypothetical protein [Tropicibacter naphthalenivorans]|uniref:Uncharacterized protein n=1 Tax=Tropicibacter naphthalenivorans TaxID=441103 RepID=A0A0P1G9K7_9RHOB|nr:hypothetical protein [Tropicibacter naphthalenivorans]CUH78237.1 hypothetical protein TRN7648_01869 [Tropicibacter naphthalenivorans]SMC78574.1 hypothetical protein SAMN04488093_10431 [Tropicibacter naphthalenivorans]